MTREHCCEEYSVLQTNRNIKKIISLITFILFLSYLSGMKLFEIMISYQERKQILFSNIIFKIIVVFYISIFLHELGHFIFIKICDYKFRLFIVGPLIFINDNSKIKIRLKITNLIASGLVMMDINSSIKSENDLSEFIMNFKKISLGGVFFNIALILIGIYMMFYKSTIDTGFIIVVINISTIVACILPSGDIARLIKLNKEQSDIVLYFVEDLVINYKINEFCKKSIYAYLNNMLSSQKYDVNLLNVLFHILNYTIINDEDISEEIYKFINWFIVNYNNIIATQNVYIKIKAIKLIYLIRDYNLGNHILMNQLTIGHKNLGLHPLNKVYCEFECYNKKNLILNNIRIKIKDSCRQ